MNNRSNIGEFFTVMAVLLCMAISQLANAQTQERPPSEALLPETTVGYVQFLNVRDMVEKLKNSNGGKLLADERIAPLFQDLYGVVADAYSEVEDKVGLSLDDIRSLPAGEICFAIIAPRRKTPAFVLLIDTDEDSEVVDKALDRGRQLATETGIEMETEELESVSYETFTVDGQKFSMFRREGTIVLGTDQDVLNDLVTRWDGGEVEKIRPLKENRKFITIMNRCRSSNELPADMRYFFDPIKLAQSATRGNVAAQGALNFLPLLGLDGFLGVGGTIVFNELEFESVSRMQVLLANPRAGIIEMLALKPGEYRPQPWVPANSVLYTSTSWDVGKMYAEIEKLYNTFNAGSSMEEEIQEEINEEIGIDFKEDLLDQLSGRVTFVQWVGEEVAFNGQIVALGVGLKDADKFMETVEVILEKIRDEQGEDVIEEYEYEGTKIWKRPDNDVEEDRKQVEDVVPVTIRVQQPCFALIDDHVIFSDGPEFLEAAIDTARGKGPALQEDGDFQYVSDHMNRLMGTDLPGAIMYSRPEETMRMFFNVLKGDDTGDFLDEMAEENEYLGRIRDALEDHPLPDFDEIKHYFPPSGAFIINDDAGYHLLGFQLKSDDRR